MMAAMGLPSFAAGGGMQLQGGAGGSAGPATGTAVDTITPAFDASNWTVATGSAKAGATNASGQAGSLANVPWLYVGAALVVGLVLWKRL